MCGLFAVVCNPSRSGQIFKVAESVAGCSQILKSRGPDSSSVYKNADLGIFLYHSLLHVEGDQPISQPYMVGSEEGFAFNGSIFSFDRGSHRFKERKKDSGISDTTLLGEAIKEQGIGCLDTLNLFGAIIYFNKDVFIAFVDRYGFKPLYFCELGDLSVFSSSERLIRVFLERTDLHINYVFKDDVDFNEIQKLTGCIRINLQKEVRNIQPQPVNYFSGLFFASERAPVERLILNDFVRACSRQLSYRLDNYILLSGGVDGSAILAVGAYLGYRMKAVTVSTESLRKRGLCEIDSAKKIADAYGVKHLTKIYSDDELSSLRNQWEMQIDTNLNDGFNVYLAARIISQDGGRLGFIGIGADEMNRGYQQVSYSLLISAIPERIRKILAWILTPIKTFWIRKLRALLRMDSPFAIGIASRRATGWYNGDCVSELLNEIEKIKATLKMVACDENMGGGVTLRTTQKANQVYLSQLYGYTSRTLIPAADEASMSLSVELRAPYLDYDLVDHYLALSPKQKKMVTKNLFKKLHPANLKSSFNKKRLGFAVD